MYKLEKYGKGGIYAKVVADSSAQVKCINGNKNTRITTLELRFHRFILPEFNTHRVFSRNASSSRAIPVNSILRQLTESPAMPIHWGANQSGMQADKEHDNTINYMMFDYDKEKLWEFGATVASSISQSFAEAGYHKQIVNRITEPYQFTKVIVTSTEWDNFLKLRFDLAAQPEIYELARLIKACLDENVPDEIITLDSGAPNKIHIPYVSDEEIKEHGLSTMLKCSVARCARVSYKNHDKSNPDIEKDLKLYDQLLSAGHMSPFEHQSRPMYGLTDNDFHDIYKTMLCYPGITHFTADGEYCSNNFKNWIQYRALL